MGGQGASSLFELVELESLVTSCLILCSQLVGGIGATYVREVTFVVPAHDGPPTTSTSTIRVPAHVLQASINLSLTSIIACHERISYVGNKSDPGTTVFRQAADFIAQGAVAAGTMGQRIGKKVEQVSVDRCVGPALLAGPCNESTPSHSFASNAHVGQEGFSSVLEALYGTTAAVTTMK